MENPKMKFKIAPIPLFTITQLIPVAHLKEWMKMCEQIQTPSAMKGLPFFA